MDVPSLRDEPKVHPAHMWVWSAFALLSQKRFRIQGDPQPIQLSEIVVYLDEAGLADEVRREIVMKTVTALDSQYMDAHWERVTAEAAKQKAGARK